MKGLAKEVPIFIQIRPLRSELRQIVKVSGLQAGGTGVIHWTLLELVFSLEGGFARPSSGETTYSK